MEYRKVAIIVAGGSGTRMQSSVPKQFLELAGKPVLLHTIQAFATAFDDMEIVLVVPSDHLAYVDTLLKPLPVLNRITIVSGGKSRFHSVKNGLKHAKDAVVFVHDGVRPLVSTSLIRSCYESALQYGSAIPVIDMKDSIREISGNDNKAVDRDKYKIIQTPQTFLSDILLPAFELPFDALFTDEATVVERLGNKVHLIQGEESNIKITKPLDLTIAAALLRER